VISAFFFFFFFYVVMLLAIFKCEFLEAAKAKTLSFKKEKKRSFSLERNLGVVLMSAENMI
jgi:hypothetical protein